LIFWSSSLFFAGKISQQQFAPQKWQYHSKSQYYLASTTKRLMAMMFVISKDSRKKEKQLKMLKKYGSSVPFCASFPISKCP